jgi:hypothetical protein
MIVPNPTYVVEYLENLEAGYRANSQGFRTIWDIPLPIPSYTDRGPFPFQILDLTGRYEGSIGNRPVIITRV